MKRHFQSRNGPYWFKPARFWNWFAAYYPVSWQGWIIFAAFLIIIVHKFRVIDASSHSGSDTLIGFAPWFIGAGIAYDILTRLKGEYPSWWRKYKRN